MPLPVVQSSIPLDKVKTDGSENGATVSAKINKAFDKIDNAIFRDGSMELRQGYTPHADQDISTKIYTDTKVPTDGSKPMDPGYSPQVDQDVATKKYLQDELTKENPTRNPFSIITQLSDINLKDSDFVKDNEFLGLNIITKAMPDGSLLLIPGDITTPTYNSILPDKSETILRIFKHTNADYTVEAFTRKGDRPIQWMGSYNGVQGHERWSGWKRVSQSDTISMIVYTTLKELNLTDQDFPDETIGISKIFNAMDKGTTAILNSQEIPELAAISPKPSMPGTLKFVKGGDARTIEFYSNDGVTKAFWVGNFGQNKWSGWTDVSSIDTSLFLSYKGTISSPKDIKETGIYFSTLLQDSPDGNPDVYSLEAFVTPGNEIMIRAVNTDGIQSSGKIDLQGNLIWESTALENKGSVTMDKNYIPQKRTDIATKDYVDQQAAQKGAIKVFEVKDETEMMGYISVGEGSTFVMDNGQYWVRNSGVSGTIADFSQVASNPEVHFVQTLNEMYNLDSTLGSTVIVHETNNTYIKINHQEPDVLGNYFQIRVHSEPKEVKTINEMISLPDPIPGKIVTVTDESATFVLKAGVSSNNPSSWMKFKVKEPVPLEVKDFSVVKQLDKPIGTIFVLDKEKQTIIRKQVTTGDREDYIKLLTHGSQVDFYNKVVIPSDGSKAPQGNALLRLVKARESVNLRAGHSYTCDFIIPGVIARRYREYHLIARVKSTTAWTSFGKQTTSAPFATDVDELRIPIHLNGVFDAGATDEYEFGIGIFEVGAMPGLTPTHAAGDASFRVTEITK